MPELPEVEVTRRRIAPLLVGRRIGSVHTTKPSYLFITPPAQLRRSLSGRTVGALDRRGKYLVAHLDDGSRFVVHLGMTGQLFSESAASPRLMLRTARSALSPEAQRRFRPDAHTHLRICFEDAGPEVFLRDVRKFGKLMWLRAGEEHPRLDRLGVDALEITGDVLFAAGRKRKVAIKNLLLDQSVLAGVGNIYADEALFLAGVRPTRAAGRVSRRECECLAQMIRQVLSRSIETGGASIRDYVTPDGSDGGYQFECWVYARKGEPCGHCGEAIRRIVVGQRSTHYCPSCQK
ncbi:MAG: bifunctional DNA-formamidopyrimidine glycosylase/DNA-(apurinic or apyrimidinic site) lyase [Myxococcales bacterium]|nr:bifunctional DNA-formamidopyrimidine glycosylase/DNA-(apurinic or apyrimidinic site) lyase [Myxococcales bacterium]